MDEPILVDQADPSVHEWGRYRMPKIYRMPDGPLALTYQVGRDHYCDQGMEGPLWLSGDDGRTWRRGSWPHPAMRGMNPIVSAAHDGEFWCLPAQTGLELDPARLPPQVGHLIGMFPLHRLDQCDPEVVRWVQDLVAVRWTPGTGRWTEERIGWPRDGQLLWTYDDRPQSIPGVWTQKPYAEAPVIRLGDELLLTDYWSIYDDADGNVPTRWPCMLMASRDNGHTWERRSDLPVIPALGDTSEPVLERDAAGELVAVMRVDNADMKSRPMLVTRSADAGRTWSEPRTLFGSGVFPRLLQLANGILVLAYGRAPGTWLSFSRDGGRSWCEPYAILAPEAAGPHCCGYTSLVAVGDDSFLIAFASPRADPAGAPCKSILVQRVSVS